MPINSRMNKYIVNGISYSSEKQTTMTCNNIINFTYSIIPFIKDKKLGYIIVLKVKIIITPVMGGGRIW